MTVSRFLFLGFLGLFSCQPLPLDRAKSYAWVVYDPGAANIPMPNDALFDEESQTLNLPTDDDELSEAEIEFREALNAQSGWSSTSEVTAEFSERISSSSVNSSTFQIWEWGVQPSLVEGLEVELDADGKHLSVLAPATGWKRGATYFAFVRGGANGLKTENQQDVGPDAAFTYLQHTEPLDLFENQRAFPGDTREERMENGQALEEIRLQLTPMFEHLAETSGIGRQDVAAMWRFSVTQDVELAMDPDSERVPLPYDLLFDRETGRIDLPPNEHDNTLEADAKIQANTLNGFSVSGAMMFELTGAVDPSTVTPEHIQVFDISVTAEPVETRVYPMAPEGEGPCLGEEVSADCKYIVIELTGTSLPLKTANTYAILVTQGLQSADGGPVKPMPIGQMMLGTAPLAVDETSMLSILSNEDASRLEWVRQRISPYLDKRGREDLITAWPFTTLDPMPALREVSNRTKTLGFQSKPAITSRKPAYSILYDDALSDLFPGILNPAPVLYWPRTNGIAEVVEGTLPYPNYLDDVSRQLNDEYTTENLNFMAIVPEDVSPPYPVVIFGHAIVTDRRFLMTIGGALAKRGFASVAIDFPYHGERIACVDASLVAVPNIFPPDLRPIIGFEDDLIWLPPCESGDDATCAPTGECLDRAGNVEDFNSFPIIDLQPASGAAFMDISDIPHIPDHFHQAFMDLGTLKHSLQTEDWSEVFDGPIQTDRFWYAGQSLGSIIGFTWVSANDDIERAAFNVPGSNLVNLFQDSTYFSTHVDATLKDIEVEPGSYDQVRLFSIASWLVDAIDPHTVARGMRDSDQNAMIQIDKVNGSIGDIIIPNYTTENLARVSEFPLLAYPSALHADLIVPGLGEPMLNDMADYLAGDLNP
jgi:hypothetical protein